MTTTQELIARLRGFGIFGEANALLREGAASIESLSAEVERLESDVLVQKGMARLARGECDQLRAQVEAQGEAVEPVAWRGRPLADEDWVLYWSKPHSVEVLEPLYTHPAPAAPVVTGRNECVLPEQAHEYSLTGYCKHCSAALHPTQPKGE